MPAWTRALPLLALCVAACGHELPKNVPLVQGASATADLDTLIEQRLLARWPIGASEQGLAEHLRAQGFTIDRRNPYYVESRLRWGGVLYGKQAKVYWRTDRRGKITELNCNVESAGPLGPIDDL